MNTMVPAFDGFPEAPVSFSSFYTKFKHFSEPANCVQASPMATSLFLSAPEMFRCLLQGLPKLTCVLAANTKMGEVTVCSLFGQKKPRVLMTSLHPSSTLFPVGQKHRLKAKVN